MSVCFNKLKIYGEAKTLSEIDEKFEKISEFDNYSQWFLNCLADGKPELIEQLHFCSYNEQLTERDFLYVFGTSWIDVLNTKTTSAMMTIEYDSSWESPIVLAEAVSLFFECSVILEYSEPIKDKGEKLAFSSGLLEGRDRFRYYEFQLLINGDLDSLIDLFDLVEDTKELEEELEKNDIKLAPDEWNQLVERFNLLKDSVKNKV